ncbi:hypothetical protein KQP89_15330, partial [Lactiplantibacillus plantarum]|uniref:hypothetical protein n=1 Tax=Lactiplantibacillus plantarum TaxID=1590 RepID=UPI00377029B5
FRRVSGATDALFLFSIISKAGLEKSEDFSRPALFLETYVTASFLCTTKGHIVLCYNQVDQNQLKASVRYVPRPFY